MFTSLIEKLKSKKSNSANATTNSDSSKIEANTKEGAVTYKYKNTPIWVRGDAETGYFLTLGDYRITEPLETIDECEKLIKTRDLNLLITIMSAIIYAKQDSENIDKTSKEIMEKHAPEGTNQNEEA